MTLRDIFETTDRESEVILRLIQDNMHYEDVVATWDNIDEYSYLSIMCLVPQDKKLIIEIA